MISPMPGNDDHDIRYLMFKVYCLATASLGLLFALVNLINRRPPVNIITGAAILLLSLLWYFMAKKGGGWYTAARLSFLIVLSVLWVPFGYLTSPGADSAMPYLVLLAAFITTVAARNSWEYVFPALMIIQMPFLFHSELWFPELFPAYGDQAYRMQDLSLNFTVASGAVVASTIYMIKRHARFTRDVYELSIHDDLTGLYNKRFFLDYMDREHDRAMRIGKNYSLVIIGLNNFKQLNIEFGRHFGDQILSDLASLIHSNIRSYDICARYGGDEFIMVFPETEEPGAQNRMRELDSLFRDFCEPYKQLGFSIVYGIAGSRGKTVKQVIHSADELLYKKKS